MTEHLSDHRKAPSGTRTALSAVLRPPASRKALELNAEHIDSLNNLGVLLVALKGAAGAQEAEELYGRALKARAGMSSVCSGRRCLAALWRPSHLTLIRSSAVLHCQTSVDSTRTLSLRRCPPGEPQRCGHDVQHG